MHCAHSEPLFYESAYQYVDRPDSMSIDDFGRYKPEFEVSLTLLVVQNRLEMIIMWRKRDSIGRQVNIVTCTIFMTLLF